MIAGMPVGSNRINLITYLNRVFTPNTYERAYYKGQVRSEVTHAVQRGWLPAGFNVHVDYVMNTIACIKSCESGGAPDFLVDWVFVNSAVGHVARHLSYINASDERIGACRSNTLDYIVDTMVADSAFDPPYTAETDKLYEMLFY